LFSFWSVTNQENNAGSRQRLQQWSSHILARVDEDTRHKAFEIHDYGTSILNSFGMNAIGQVKKFRDVSVDFLSFLNAICLDCQGRPEVRDQPLYARRSYSSQLWQC
jgi:hypothetical protein